MDEQPVAFATTARSPNNCETSFTYGVSPQPAHAPLNSNNGRSNCEFLIVEGLINFRSRSGIDMKKSQFFVSCSRNGGCAAMLSALRPTCVLSFAGQTSTHNVQPVQSSGATWTEYAMPCENSLNFDGICLKASGALASSFSSKTLW